MSNERILHKIGNAIDYPLEQIRGKTVIEIVDGSFMTIENHCGVMAYSHECIRVNTPNGLICIKGTCLKVAKICREQLGIHGGIQSVDIVGRE